MPRPFAGISIRICANTVNTIARPGNAIPLISAQLKSLNAILANLAVRRTIPADICLGCVLPQTEHRLAFDYRTRTERAL